MSYAPRPYRRPFSTRGSNGASIPATPTVSRCALSSSERPPPLPRAIAIDARALRRPDELDVEAGALGTSRATKCASSRSPAAPAMSAGLTESIATRRAARSVSAASATNGDRAALLRRWYVAVWPRRTTAAQRFSGGSRYGAVPVARTDEDVQNVPSGPRGQNDRRCRHTPRASCGRGFTNET